MGLTRPVIAALAVHLLGTAAYGADCGPYEDEERATHRRVTWADFQGPPPLDYQVRLKKVVEKAHIATTLTVEPPEIEVRPAGPGQWVARAQHLCVRAFVIKGRSGYNPDARTPRSLAHEQGHFDITEYFARELRQVLTGLDHRANTPERAREGLWRAIQKEYRDTVARWKKTQARYDRETRHNQRTATQKRWLEELKTLLADSAPRDADQSRIARGAPDPYTQAEARYRP